jgi:hypothetical protein
VIASEFCSSAGGHENKLVYRERLVINHDRESDPTGVEVPNELAREQNVEDDPDGTEASSRWLSEATPPEWRFPTNWQGNRT